MRAIEILNRLEDELGYAEKLLENLGDPSEWRYTGEMADAGPGATKEVDPPRCACGHEIRFIFFIEHPTKGRSQVGSTCVRHFKDVNPQLYQDLLRAVEKMVEKVREEERKKEQARRAQEVETLRQEFEKKKAEFWALVSRLKEGAPKWQKRPLPYPIWSVLNRQNPRVWLSSEPDLKSQAAYIRFYREQIYLITQLIQNPEKMPEKK